MANRQECNIGNFSIRRDYGAFSAWQYLLANVFQMANRENACNPCNLRYVGSNIAAKVPTITANLGLKVVF